MAIQKTKCRRYTFYISPIDAHSTLEVMGLDKEAKEIEDFGSRMLPALDLPTGIPYYWVNLKTGEARGGQYCRGRCLAG